MLVFRMSAATRGINRWEAAEGAPAPLGATWIESQQAYNFALYSRHATHVELLFYTPDDLTTPALNFVFDYRTNKSGRIWHCMIPAARLNGARYYAYRVDGPRVPALGHRFDPQKILFDPYAPAIFFPPDFSRADACGEGPNDGRAPLGVLPRREDAFDWEGDTRPRHTHDAVIYELHVRGFSARENSGVPAEHRGTFAGIVDKIPYLRELGVTIVELLPVQQYDPQEGNYWGYMTLHFFSPHHGYASEREAIDEFRAMVRALHAAGIEVLLDVVYNHTSEGDERGPMYSYRGIDNRSYYLLQDNSRRYRNDAGTGNVLRCAEPGVRRMIVDSLHFWTDVMHVDGFRFDLASIFTRTNDGSINLGDPPLITEISSFASYAGIRLIAEAWDINSYQLGRSFPGITWLQWNGKFRDDVRSFLKGDPGKVGDLMLRLYGSDDLFPDQLFDTYRPSQSVNFVTAHDGFCLYDLVSYNQKHNEINGHGNTDGTDDNLSWNCGWEGDEGAPPEVLRLRRQQVKNFCCLLLLANGTPMFVAGDEFMNTQFGNNNPYNQDNEITWLDWDRLEQNRDVFRFFKLMIAFRKAHPSLGRSRFWRGDVHWYGVGPQVDLGHDSHALAYCLHGASQNDDDLYVMINAFWEDLHFTIQEGAPGDWLRVVDTSKQSPYDIAEPGWEPLVDTLDYAVRARSIVVLRRSRRPDGQRPQ